MSISRLVHHFEGLGKVPVDLEEVLSMVRSLVPHERVSSYGVDTDPSVLRGQCVTVKEDDGALYLTRITHSRITYSTRMPLCEQRLVCCKELLHVLDPDPIKTTKQEQVLDLAAKMAANSKPSISSANGLRHFHDELAKWQALAVLFPFGYREAIYPLYKSGGVSLQDVADETQLPAEYVSVVLSDVWGVTHDTILTYA